MGFPSQRGTGMFCCRPISGVPSKLEALKQCKFKVGPDTVLQTQDSKFEPCRSEAEHTTSRSRRLPTLQVDGEETYCFFQTAETGNQTPHC